MYFSYRIHEIRFTQMNLSEKSLVRKVSYLQNNIRINLLVVPLAKSRAPESHGGKL